MLLPSLRVSLITCLRDTRIYNARIAQYKLAFMTPRPSMEPSRIDDALSALERLGVDDAELD